MDLKFLHFANQYWLWALLFIPLVWGLFFLYARKQQPLHQLERFIDPHLIPYLLVHGAHQKQRLWTRLLIWTLVWSCLVLALAGPRWNMREINTFTRDQSLAIVLDLSESMNVQDVSPSRLKRAKQTIEDLLKRAKENGVKIGLIAFAADPHMITPMTEDIDTIYHLLPALDTDLVYVQGSKLSPALEMAATMLHNEPGNNKALVVISDGGFEDASAIQTAGELAGKGIVLYTIGVGSLEGAPLKDHYGVMLKKNGAPILSKLEKEKFREISTVGNGRYFDADYSGGEAQIFEDLKQRSQTQEALHKTHHIWEEHFYLLLIPILPFFLWWCQRRHLFALFLFILMPTYAHASVKSYFYNAEQQAHRAFERGDFVTAGDDFQDPYRKGVAYYRMGNFAAAEEMFRQSTRPEVASSAAYNLGNSLVKQNKLHDAITAYEEVLKQWPDHTQAKENLELVKKMLEEQRQQEQQEQQQQNQDQKQQQQEQQEQQQKQQQEQDQKQQQQEQQQQQDNQNNEQGQDSAQQERQEQSEKQEEPPENQETPQEETEPQAPQEPPKEQTQKQKMALQQGKETPEPRCQKDLDADLWLDQIKNDSKTFLKNQFYLESKKNGPKEEVDPW